MSPPLSKKKKMTESELQDVVDGLSDLSDVDDEDSDDETVSHSSAYSFPLDDNLIEKRLEQLFGISYSEVANSEEVDHEPPVEEHVGESLQDILDSENNSPDTPASAVSFVGISDSLALKSVPLVADNLLASTSFKKSCSNLPASTASLPKISNSPASVIAGIKSPAKTPFAPAPTVFQGNESATGTVISKELPSSIPSLLNPIKNNKIQILSNKIIRPASETKSVSKPANPIISLTASSIKLNLPILATTPCHLPAAANSDTKKSVSTAGSPSSSASVVVISTSTSENVQSPAQAHPLTTSAESSLHAFPRRTEPLMSNKISNQSLREWKTVEKIHKVPEFDRKILPMSKYTHKTQPVAIFLNFFPENLINSIVIETNLYASQNNSENWADISSEELKAYLGVLIMMGLNPLPDVELYWSTDPFYNNPEISTVLPRSTYKKITKNLHLRDNSQAPPKNSLNYDKLYKLRTVINIFNEIFQNQMSNSSKQSIDECMVKYKGRSSLKQYMPKKPIKRGFKVWARCDAATGYLYQFEVYTGKGDSVENEGLGYNVVWKLCQNVPPNTLLAFDNFFTNCNLMDDLFFNGIYAVGTVRINRKDLPDIIKKTDQTNKIKKNEFVSVTAGPLSAIKWMDTRDVTVLTTAHHPRDVTTVKRTQKDGTKKDTLIPAAIASYTETMGGVDHFDHFSRAITYLC